MPVANFMPPSTAALFPGEELPAGTHRTGSIVGLGVLKKRKMYCLSRDSNCDLSVVQAVSLVTTLSELPWMRIVSDVIQGLATFLILPVGNTYSGQVQLAAAPRCVRTGVQ